MKAPTALLAAAAILLGSAAAAAGQPEPQRFAFWPQAGTLGQDLLLQNTTDADPAAGVLRDPWCGTRTYDGHNGADVILRGFGEQDIGVPVFAALDGTVTMVEDGMRDHNLITRGAYTDNHVVLDHGNGQYTVYGHLRNGSIPVKLGDRVVAGTQLGLTGSSGNSSWPHLHLTSIVDNVVVEPFGGPCNPLPSGFVDQPELATDPYVRSLVLSPNPFRGQADLPFDKAVRSGTYRAGRRDLYAQVLVAEVAGGSLTLRLVRPDGSTAFTSQPALPALYHGNGELRLHARARLDRHGRWKLQLDLAGQRLAEAPFLVVGAGATIRNRPPAPIGVALDPPAPTAADVPFCRVQTALIGQDPDYDLVRYRYRWTVDGRVVRQVTSAALGDAIPRGTAPTGSSLACSVTPSDGRRSGPPASVGAVVG